MTLRTKIVGLLQYAQGDDVQTYLQRWLAQSMRITDGLFDPTTGHNHNGLGGNGSLVGCHLIGSFDGAVSWTMPTANTWTETPIQTTVTLSGARTRIEFAFTVTGPTKGQAISYTIMVDGGLPGVSPPALGIADIPENNFLVSCAGTYYVVPAAGSRRLAVGLYGPAGVQLWNQIQSTLYVTEQNPAGPSGVGSGGGLMTWRGAWSSSTAYNVNDGVSYGGGSYVCIGSVGPTSTTPDTDPTHWGVLAQPGAPGPAGPPGTNTWGSP